MTRQFWRLNSAWTNAVTSCAYVISVNRPGEPGGPIGGPSLAIAPSGEVLLETDVAVATVTLEKAALTAAHDEYPGYLDVRADLYERGWRQVKRSNVETPNGAG